MVNFCKIQKLFKTLPKNNSWNILCFPVFVLSWLMSKKIPKFKILLSKCSYRLSVVSKVYVAQLSPSWRSTNIEIFFVVSFRFFFYHLINDKKILLKIKKKIIKLLKFKEKKRKRLSIFVELHDGDSWTT